MSRRPHLPTLNWLRTFESAARHMSFTTAAAELNLTQAAVSQQIKLLEHYLCQPLFQRMPRGLQLTEAGKAYLPKVKDALDRLSMATQEVFGQVKQEEHALDELMASIAGFRIVGKKGIHFDRRIFIDPTGQLYMHVGEPVTLRYDEEQKQLSPQHYSTIRRGQ
jgi:DNA-binding MarR family transcriptional regulator